MPHPAPDQPPKKRPRRSRSLPTKRNQVDDGLQEKRAGATTRWGGRRRSPNEVNDEAATHTRHRGRVRNGVVRQNSEQAPPEQATSEAPLEEFDQEIESLAYILASIDKKAYAESQLADANRICHELLLPLSLPWAYPEQALDATTPLDLEDLPMLVRGDLGDHEISRTSVVPTDDPGVLRLSCYGIDPSHFEALNFIWQPERLSQDATNLSQEVSLLHYEAVVARKRKMDELESSGIIPLYLAALFPRSLQEGHRRRGPEAVALAKFYGTYNCRGLPLATHADGIFEERIWVGRNRLAWSERELNQKTNRGVYRSMLTKKRSDLAKLKRPIAVKVSLRLNGRLVATQNVAIKQSIDKMLATLGDSKADHKASLYSEAMLDECLKAIEEMTTTEVKQSFLPRYTQCSLSPDALFQNIAADTGGVERNAVRRLRQPIRFSVQSDSEFIDEDSETDVGHTIGFQPPHLDCFGTVDGLVHVCCTRAGSFSSHSLEGGDDVSYVLAQEFAIKYERCFVCWGRCDIGSTVRCSVCSIAVHCECTHVSEDGKKNKWVCSGCDDPSLYHKDNGRTMGKCCQCPLPLGLLKKLRSDVIHHVCATWKGTLSTKKEREVCCLCSAGSGSLVECAAEGCRVKFHASCATLASAFGDLGSTNAIQDDDVYLCTQYTLAMVDSTLGSSEESMRLPVAFCGYHNPRRSDMFHGLYPEGCYLDPYSETTPALRIPPKRSTHVVSNYDETENESSE